MALEDVVEATGVYQHSLVTVRDNGEMLFTLPERLPAAYQDPAAILHIANGEEYLYDLAHRYYVRQHTDAVNYWEMIGLMQSDPIQDMSVPVPAGREIYIPSIAFIEETLNGETQIDIPNI